MGEYEKNDNEDGGTDTFCGVCAYNKDESRPITTSRIAL